MAVVGGGITGTVAALELAKTGCFDVTIFEKEKRLGGLSSYDKWEDVVFDRFYHVILSTDKHLIEFIKELGLESQLFWRTTKSGFYGNGKLVSLSSMGDFARFPFLSFGQKIRLGVGILYSTQAKNPAKLDKIFARQWLSKIFGRDVYEKIWDPLLRSKFGEAKDRTSAAFIWATIKRLYSARSLFRKQEEMGHVHGGYYTIWNAVHKKLDELNVRVYTDAQVLSVRYDQSRKKIILATKLECQEFDRILFAVPSLQIFHILDHIDHFHPYCCQLQQVEYLGVICVLMILKRKNSSYYVINLLDNKFPFTGIIESTNVISPEEIGGKHLIYLPKYLLSDDPMNDLSDHQVIELFETSLKRVFPDLKDEEISHKQIFREKYVQPIPKLQFSSAVADFHTPLANLYVVNTASLVDSTANNNATIKMTRQVIKAILSHSKKGK